MTVAAGTAGRRPDVRGTTGRSAFRMALLLLPIGVLGNVAYTLLATDRALLRSLSELPRGYLIGALALTLVPWLTGTLRLLIWTRFLEYAIPLRELFRMTLIVDIGAAASPTAIGGEAFKWGMLMRHGVRPGAAASIAIVPKLEDGMFFLVALPAAVVWTGAWRLPVVASSARLLGDNVLAVAAIACAVGLLSRGAVRLVLRGHAGARLRRRAFRLCARSRRRLQRAWSDGTRVFALIARRGKARLALTLSLTTLHWLARYGVVCMVALFLRVPFDPVLFWLLQWVVFTIMSFIPTPGAAGGAEIAFTAVYATLLPAGVIGIATAAWRLSTFYVPVALAALVFTLTARRPDLRTGAP
ncbi:MAG: lysylphosphatidylglycerol synthase transmembrane domain-containing protein [Gemmatimonadota bacterium]